MYTASFTIPADHWAIATLDAGRIELLSKS